MNDQISYLTSTNLVSNCTKFASLLYSLVSVNKYYYVTIRVSSVAAY
jgi:hypothetical protein